MEMFHGGEIAATAAGDVIGQGIILPYCNLGDSVTAERIGGFGSTSK